MPLDTTRCEAFDRTEKWSGVSRCVRTANQHITIARGPLEAGVVVWEGIVCPEHMIEAIEDTTVTILTESI